jgi:hypothetical protein
VVCILLASSVYLLDIHTGNIWRIFTVPLVTWLIIAASIFPAIRICGYLVDIVMRVMELAFSRVENIHYVLIGTSRGLRHASPTIASPLLVYGIVNQTKQMKNSPTTHETR